jgi:antitoxin component YwqK of YwqJK toxin-antitoxin module
MAFEKHWDNGTETGRWEYYYKNGQLKKIGLGKTD